MKAFFKFLKSIFLQFILAIVAVISWINSNEIGNRTEDGTYYKNYRHREELTGTSIDAGFDGGALAMGIICSVCIIMIVWIEINKKSKH
jgi:hypothetical protein